MQGGMDGDTLRLVEQLGISFDRRSGVYTFQGSQEFYFDLRNHVFTLDNTVPEDCFPVMGNEKSFGEEFITALYAQLEQYLIKEIACREKVKKLLASLKQVKSPVVSIYCRPRPDETPSSSTTSRRGTRSCSPLCCRATPGGSM